MRFSPALLLAVLFAALPAAAQAKTEPCIPGQAQPRCQSWTMNVSLVADGDTIHGTVNGKKAEVRFIGINAMEFAKGGYSRTPSKRRGPCMSVPAANFIDKLIGKKVKLMAQRASSRSGHRIRRSVFAKKGGRWIDVAKAEIAAGYALFLPNGDEWAHNLEYQKLAATARAAGSNLWNPAACGGPDLGATLSVVAKWDADGNDGQNLNGEYIEVRNLGLTAVDLSGWWVRDSYLNWWQGKDHGIPGYKFANGTTLAPQSALRVHIGSGADDARDLHWGLKDQALENVTYDKTHIGDGVYLFDSEAGMRASFVYPCVAGCIDPLKAKVRVKPHPNNPEYIELENTTAEPVDLADHALRLRNRGKAGQFVFTDVFDFGTVIAPGDTFRYRAQEDNRFSDNGGVVELVTLDDMLTDCAAWGFGKC
jgi:micrococcal nuclease